MRLKVGESLSEPPRRRACSLIIRYAAAGPRGQERRVVYVRYGVPPVTAAEIEIMHQHLEELTDRLSPRVGQNEV